MYVVKTFLVRTSDRCGVEEALAKLDEETNKFVKSLNIPNCHVGCVEDRYYSDLQRAGVPSPGGHGWQVGPESTGGIIRTICYC